MQLNFLREIFILVLSDLSQFLETPKSAILEGWSNFSALITYNLRMRNF